VNAFLHFSRPRTAIAFACALVFAANWPAGPASAQESAYPVRGIVRSATGAPVGDVTLTTEAGARTTTDAAGAFVLRLERGPHTLRASHPGYMETTREIEVSGPLDGEQVVLEALARVSEDVVVAAVRADAEAPITKRDLDRREISALNAGQEMPFLLQQVPSLNQYSDAGSATGYAYLTLRGIPQTRMNVTLDGVPLNEPEDSAFYFANFGDFGNAVESIQVQRGVGTSTVGAASFVGSINFASVDIKDTRQADVRLGVGAFGTNRVSAAVHSGQLGAGLKLYGQAAYQDTDGFRRHSGITQQSLYLGAARTSSSSFFKVFGFRGRERTQLAFLAADEETLKQDLRFNPMSPDERDNFSQTFVTTQYHRTLGPSSEISAQGYFNGADGYYRIQDAAAGLFQYGLRWRSVGATTTYHLQRNGFDFTWGAHLNDFKSQHSRGLVEGVREYANHGFKNELNTFVKLSRTMGAWHHYGDVQVRWARFRYDGSERLGPVDWTFVNPKAGTRVDVGRGVSIYASIGRAGREPARSDMLQGEDNASLPYDLTAVKPERVFNVETGVELVRPGLSAQVNGYLMEFRQEIAQTGELSEIGLPLRRNVDSSYRRGVEVDVTWQPAASVRIQTGHGPPAPA
jgi:iron complex outermembrane receptor protein